MAGASSATVYAMADAGGTGSGEEDLEASARIGFEYDTCWREFSEFEYDSASAQQQREDAAAELALNQEVFIRLRPERPNLNKWQRYVDPPTGKHWWCKGADETQWFWEGQLPWKRYHHPIGGRFWWHKTATEWFYEDTGLP